MSLNDLLGTDDAPWMSDPNRNCDIRYAISNKPDDVQEFADNWFPTDGNERRAKRLCAGCPQVNACLMFAMGRPELDGVWGQTTTAERAMLRRDGVA